MKKIAKLTTVILLSFFFALICQNQARANQVIDKKQVVSYLESISYKVVVLEGMLQIVDNKGYMFLMSQLSLGNQTMGVISKRGQVFRFKKLSGDKSSDVLAFLNVLNRKASVSRFFISDGVVNAAGYIPGNFNVRSYAAYMFLRQLDMDMAIHKAMASGLFE